MGERWDELKGRAKQMWGAVTGNRGMTAEGEREEEGARTERKVKGTAEEAAGSLRAGAGAVTGDRTTQVEGEVERAKGRTNREG